ncbi:unnamed protein product [Fusarium graminearum]|uniref:Uncharacterized protein n=2 Tax=Gibberella zeae TaxID=5518 RepID=A0A4E9E1P7_GIBZA|nr:unnamed protein product [Fusarium graminearum]CAG1970622.1 unnamed protein product [Fusarium graminearum]CAG2011445.1 unnamed protein product [Fusarium graminearum]
MSLYVVNPLEDHTSRTNGDLELDMAGPLSRSNDDRVDGGQYRAPGFASHIAKLRVKNNENIRTVFAAGSGVKSAPSGSDAIVEDNDYDYNNYDYDYYNYDCDDKNDGDYEDDGEEQDDNFNDGQ